MLKPSSSLALRSLLKTTADKAGLSKASPRLTGLTPAAVAGYPNINVPAGFSHNLPIGISFFGRAYSEPVLIKIAYAYEQATKHRRPPTFLPTIDLS